MLRKALTIIVASILVFSCTTVALATGDNVEPMPSNSYQKGDINMDSNIDISDVILVLKHTVNIITLDDIQRSYADIDSNNEINVLDALYIQKIIVDTNEAPTEKPTIPDEYIEDDKPIELPFIPAI